MNPNLESRLAEVAGEYREVEAELSSPDLDASRYADLGKRFSDLKAVVELHAAWNQAHTDRLEAEELAKADPDLAEELRDLAEEKRVEEDRIEAEILWALVPADPDDDKDVIVEVRSAAGGDEAAIWAGDLVRMYERFADRNGFKVEPMGSNPSPAGGFSEVVVAIKGRSVYSRMKYEGGVHRVQRVPKTESQGRIHTSTATVVVLPEAEAVDVDIDPAEVRIDVFRSSGPGGQSVNTTDSAVRLTHLPTGLVVSCQDEKSQLQNKEKALRILRARLRQIEQQRREAELSGTRRAQAGSGDRSEKIRTYNFKENRVTDHRVGLTVYRLDSVLDGDIEEFIEAMNSFEAARSLEG